MSRARLALSFIACLASCFGARAAEEPRSREAADKTYLLEHYTKYEHLVAMRDGVKLFTTVYAPKDDSQPYPLLLTRTPYSVRPYAVDVFPTPSGVLRNYMRDRFIFVFQDVRGRNGSQGEFVHLRPRHSGPAGTDESTDTYDTIEWLIRNVPNNNGKAGLIGLSYPGFYAAAGALDAHPALACVTPQAPVTDWFGGDDFHTHGAFQLAHAFRFFSQFGQKLAEPMREQWKPFDYRSSDGYEFFLELGPIANADAVHFQGSREFWREMMTHGTYDDFWKERNLLRYIGKVRPAVMTVGGWYDAENIYGALQLYHTLERHNPSGHNTLVMGPWSHGAWMMHEGEQLGAVPFHSRTSEFYRRNIELPFLNHFLKGEPLRKPAEAYVFETGAAQWRRHETWPPKNVQPRTLSLAAGGRLSFATAANAAEQFDEYVSDPAKPVPYVAAVATSMVKEYMVGDQRFAASRPDVLVYRTDVLDEDVTLAGPIDVQLRVSTTGTDADWVVKLIDVYSQEYPAPTPNPSGVVMAGYQQLVRGSPFRAKFRNSLETPEPLVPGEPTTLRFTMPDVYHTFRRGHRIMVQVQSSWFPLIDRNPQTFTDIYRADATAFRKATQRVYHSGKDGSRLQVRVLPRR